MIAQVHPGTQSQADGPGALHVPVRNVHGVLLIGKHDTFFDAASPHVVNPHRQAVFQPELDRRKSGFRACSYEIARTGEEDFFARHAKPFRDSMEHHKTPQWIGQCGDQQSVIPSRDRSQDRS